jgi:hypothetical protein
VPKNGQLRVWSAETGISATLARVRRNARVSHARPSCSGVPPRPSQGGQAAPPVDPARATTKARIQCIEGLAKLTYIDAETRDLILMYADAHAEVRKNKDAAATS